MKACKALKAIKPTCQPEEIFNSEPGDADGLDEGEHRVLNRPLSLAVPHLELRHSVEAHGQRGENHQHHGDQGDHLE